MKFYRKREREREREREWCQYNTCTTCEDYSKQCVLEKVTLEECLLLQNPNTNIIGVMFVCQETIFFLIFL